VAAGAPSLRTRLRHSTNIRCLLLVPLACVLAGLGLTILLAQVLSVTTADDIGLVAMLAAPVVGATVVARRAGSGPARTAALALGAFGAACALLTLVLAWIVSAMSFAGVG
jgi:hypothetical protein